ncbi:hypothetical protein [Bacillus sp. FJAT-45037]|uniref:hypothetical protein n=1 Tax=Bacillus sp. FJAT-45037 TaxID=2011007 RepID=UPI000C236170|nr:hypothetical protein [Bacillus sp. FJAT-45037]
MKSFVQFYLIIPVVFILLTTLQLQGETIQDYILSISGAAAVGLFAGFVLHMAMIISKKIKKSTPSS